MMAGFRDERAEASRAWQELLRNITELKSPPAKAAPKPAPKAAPKPAPKPAPEPKVKAAAPAAKQAAQAPKPAPAAKAEVKPTTPAPKPAPAAKPTAPAGKVAPVVAKPAQPSAKEAKSPEASLKETQIMSVLKNHPEGMPLSEIGKALGVHYVTLATSIKKLESDGKVLQRNNLYLLKK